MRNSRSSISRKRSPRRGAVAAEFAIVLAPLLMLFMVACDFSRLFYYYITITNCARNGALYLSDPVASTPSPPNSEPQYKPSYANYVAAALADGNTLNPPLDTAKFTFSSGTDADGNLSSTVAVPYDFTLISSYLGFNTRALTRTVETRVAPTTPSHFPPAP